MQIEGLNEEQINYILEQWGEKFEDSEEFLEYLRDDYTTKINLDERRHWEEFTAITQIGNRYFGYHSAHTTGDMNASEKGFQPDNWVKEYEPIEVKTVTYKEKK